MQMAKLGNRRYLAPDKEKRGRARAPIPPTTTTYMHAMPCTQPKTCARHRGGKHPQERVLLRRAHTPARKARARATLLRIPALHSRTRMHAQNAWQQCVPEPRLTYARVPAATLVRAAEYPHVRRPSSPSAPPNASCSSASSEQGHYERAERTVHRSAIPTVIACAPGS